MEKPPSVLRKWPEITKKLETMRQLWTETNTHLEQSACECDVWWWWFCHQVSRSLRTIFILHIKWNSPLNYILNEQTESNLQERLLSCCALRTIKVCAQMLMKNWLSVGNGHAEQTKHDKIMLKSAQCVPSVYKWGIHRIKRAMENYIWIQTRSRWYNGGVFRDRVCN